MNSPAAKTSSPSHLATFLAGILFLLVIFALGQGAATHPPYIDPDTATDAVFANNLSQGRAFDFPFGNLSGFQNEYRSWYAAQRLPLSAITASVTKIFNASPFMTVQLMFALGLCCWLLSCWLIYQKFLRGHCSMAEALLVGAWACSFPALYVPLRIGFWQWSLSVLLFWGALLSADSFLKTRKQLALLACAASITFFLLNPYPPLLTLFCCLVFVGVKHFKARGRAAIFDLFRAAIYCGLVGGFVILVSLALGKISFSDYWTRAEKFRATRSFSVADLPSGEQLKFKALKFINQEVLFKRDFLGDQSRPDGTETLGQVNPASLISWLLILTGLVSAAKNRLSDYPLQLLVFAAALLVHLCFSQPQARYLMFLVPSYALLLLSGATKLFKNFRLRLAALWTIAAAQFFYTVLVHRGEYRDYYLLSARSQEGIYDLAAMLPQRSHEVEEYFSKTSPITYESWLVFGALTDFRASWVQPFEVKEKISALKIKKNVRFFYLQTGNSAAEGQTLQQLGFVKEKTQASRNLGFPLQLWRWEPMNL